MNSILLIACTLVLTEKIYVHVYAHYTCKYVKCAVVSFYVRNMFIIYFICEMFFIFAVWQLVPAVQTIN